VLGDHTAIEVKAKDNVPARELNSLLALGEEKVIRRLVCVTMEPRRRQVGRVTLLPWADFLDALWSGEFRGGR
jgi:hypothetical protein